MRAPRKRVQITVSLLPGAEPWVLVKHPKGHFKLPGNASALQLLEGALSAWGQTPRVVVEGELLVKIPWSYLVELESRAGAPPGRRTRFTRWNDADDSSEAE